MEHTGRFAFLLVFLMCVHKTVCTHFRGGSFTYKPLNSSNPASMKVRVPSTQLFNLLLLSHYDSYLHDKSDKISSFKGGERFLKAKSIHPARRGEISSNSWVFEKYGKSNFLPLGGSVGSSINYPMTKPELPRLLCLQQSAAQNFPPYSATKDVWEGVDKSW